MKANDKEQLKESILKKIMKEEFGVYSDYFFKHFKSTSIDEYIKENRLVDISKKYADVEIPNYDTEDFDVDFLRNGKFTYQAYGHIVVILEVVAFKDRILYKGSGCERTMDGNIHILAPSHAFYTDSYATECCFNRTFKYKEEAAKEGFKSLEEKYEFYKRFYQNILESIPSRVEGNLNETHIKTTEEEKNELISSITDKYKAHVDNELDCFQLYKKEE
jgi:hypothetical protein